MALRLAINGFGRIGRQITRLLAAADQADIELAAVNTPEPLTVAAHLLRHDSTHGPFALGVGTDRDGLLVGDRRIPFLHQNEPDQLPWHKLGIDLVLECSGQASQRQRAERHLTAGSRKVLISAAAHGPDITLCLGVNHRRYDPDRHHIVSASSCTTNCLAPAALLLCRHFRLRSLLATFLHSYTSGQHLLDLAGGQDLRLMRAAPTNLIPAPTSAAWQVPEVIPELAGRFDAVSIRVPTPAVHLACLTARCEDPVSPHLVVEAFRQAAEGDLAGIVAVSDQPLVSIDFTGSRHSSILDATSVLVVAGDLLQLQIWHDNESSYCQRILDLVRYMASCA